MANLKGTAGLGQAATQDPISYIETSELEALRSAVKANISSEIGYVRVGFDFEGTLIDTAGLYVALQNEQMDARYGDGGKSPDNARKRYLLRKDLKGQRTWYLSAGITADTLGELMYDEFIRVSKGRADRMLTIDDPNEFLRVFNNFEGSGILTAAPHPMEDRIKGYLKHQWIVGEYYYPRDKEGTISYDKGKKVQIDCDSVAGAVDKYNSESQKRYNVLIDDSGILGKMAYEHWVNVRPEVMKTSVIKLMLIETPENQSLMERLKGRPELAAYGVITIVKDVNEAIETANVLAELIRVCSVEAGVLVEGASVGQLICYAHLQALENIRKRMILGLEVQAAQVDREFLANLANKKEDELKELVGLKKSESFKLPNNEGLDLTEIEKRKGKDDVAKKLQEIKKEADELKTMRTESKSTKVEDLSKKLDKTLEVLKKAKEEQGKSKKKSTA